MFDDYLGGYYIIERKEELISWGCNAEIGWLAVNKKSFFLYAAAGPYYLERKCHGKSWGGEMRIRPQYKDYLALDLSLSYDAFYKTVFQAELIFSIPLYQLNSKKYKQAPCGITEREIYQPIQRFEVMSLGNRSCWEFNF